MELGEISCSHAVPTLVRSGSTCVCEHRFVPRSWTMAAEPSFCTALLDARHWGERCVIGERGGRE